MAIRSSLPWMLAAVTWLSGCGDDAQRNAAGAEPASGNAAPTAANAETSSDQTIAGALGASADHSTLVGALRAAGLEATLAGPGPYTLFAPSNAGFEKLPAGTVEALMKPEQKARLTSVLTYHLVPGVVMAADLARAAETAGGKAVIATLGGGNLTVTQQGGGLVITDATGGQARVTQADGKGSNGVVHTIDSVLMPI